MTVPNEFCWPLAVPGFQGLFQWSRIGERWGHRLGRTTGDSIATWASSLEEDRASSWPASPPLQQTHCQVVGDGQRVWLGLGMSGRSHWSVSIEPTERGIRFDCACRVHGSEPWLGSTYQLSLAESIRRTGDRQLEFVWEDRVIELHAEEHCRIELVSSRSGQPAVSLVPTKRMTTTCWTYEWRVGRRH